jgi:hypothetical protein
LTEVLEGVKMKEDRVNQKKQEAPMSESIKAEKPKIIQLQERILGLAVLYSKQLEKQIKEFDSNFLDSEHKEIWNKILKGDTKKISDKLSRFEAQINYAYDQEGLEEKVIEPNFDWQEVQSQLKLFRKEEELARIIRDIREAEEKNDEDSSNMLMEEFSKISKELEELKK